MKKTFKSILKAALIVVAVVSLVMVTGEADNAKTQLLWSLGWMAILAIDCKILDKMGAFNN